MNAARYCYLFRKFAHLQIFRKNIFHEMVFQFCFITWAFLEWFPLGRSYNTERRPCAWSVVNKLSLLLVCGLHVEESQELRSTAKQQTTRTTMRTTRTVIGNSIMHQ